MLPDAADSRSLTTIRPGTHLVELSALGVTATGMTAEEAARNWRTAARRLTEERPAA
jgi:hypothetical protein